MHNLIVVLNCSDCVCQIGNSLFDAPGSEKVAALVEKAQQRGVKLVFPVDYVIADKFDKDAKVAPSLFSIFPSAHIPHQERCCL
jgi:3-phosphoglycerate kinase